MSLGENVIGKTEKNRKGKVGLVLIVVTLLLLVPIAYSWFRAFHQSATFSAIFVLRGEDVLWHSGALQMTYADGISENLTIQGPMQEYATNGTYLGLQSFAWANRNFTQPENWTFTYLCPDLNITIGPFEFETDHPKILYEDEQGRSIEMWFTQYEQ